MVKQKNSSSTQNNNVFVDLNFPGILDQIRALNDQDFKVFKSRIEYIGKLTWQNIYNTSTKNPKLKTGLNWEVIQNQKTEDNQIIASIRISKSFRARVSRKDQYMRFISLHLDHDSTYK